MTGAEPCVPATGARGCAEPGPPRRRSGARTALGRRGVTLVELLTVLVLVGILANIALPLYRNVTKKADAAKVISDYHAIQVAAYSYFAENNRFPPSAGMGQVPPDLVPFLPEGFRFSYATTLYRWRRYSLPSGPPSGGSQPWLVALTVQSPDAALLDAIDNQFGGIITQYVGNSLTLLFE